MWKMEGGGNDDDEFGEKGNKKAIKMMTRNELCLCNYTCTMHLLQALINKTNFIHT
jgi:hypothetical protein